MSEHLTESLGALLGLEALISLSEAFGGRRLYVPQDLGDEHPIARAIGAQPAARLVRRYSLAFIRVPLARELRARHYRARGLSNGDIASKLGITETGVDKLFARMERPPVKGSGQFSLNI
jgi:DNA-binding NarL/FixJ family response regulator